MTKVLVFFGFLIGYVMLLIVSAEYDKSYCPEQTSYPRSGVGFAFANELGSFDCAHMRTIDTEKVYLCWVDPPPLEEKYIPAAKEKLEIDCGGCDD